MAISNRDRINKMFEVMAPALDDYIASVVGHGDPSLGAVWPKLVENKDAKRGIAGKTYDALDPSVQFRILLEGSVTSGFKPGWYPFNDTLGRVGEAFASELKGVRDTWAHNGAFTDDDAYRALDTSERLLKLIGATDEASQVQRIRQDLRRLASAKQDERTLKASIDTPESTGLRPWREVLRPQDDVATGNFHASEFAADLHKVAFGGEQDSDYANPVQFFGRTYLTEGLRDLIGRAVRRLNGDDNAPPVINLQTNFGGGKTHSMLSLWHVAAGCPLGDLPQATQDLLAASGYTGTPVRRVALVGNHISPSGSVKDDGTRVNTLWGELAWQLGGREGFDLVAQADTDRTHPGHQLTTLLETYAPCVILIDEWVAYARSLLGRDDLAGGTFDDQFTFAQLLTEAAKGTSGVLLAISIPASESGDDPDKIAVGSAEEVGGSNGLEALKRLQNVVRRVADQWRPASSTEAYNIVKQRLFREPDAASLAEIGRTARAFVEFYRRYPDDFPRETRDAAYEARIRATYPVHPELFDRLYEQWSTLERFQRTRGVLRLMSTVVHALWLGDDASALIMPGSIPVASANVNTELTQYLQDSWKVVIDADVDGPHSEPAAIDRAKPTFGQRSLTKRLARTVFFGAAPTIGSAQKGIETQRVFLGMATPGDAPGNFHAALTQLGDRATYFYAGSGKYWYDLQANITRTARDQAERLHREDVWLEIVNRLGAQRRSRGDFAAVHVCPESNADIPDVDEARLVILHPKVSHRRKDAASAAMEFARAAMERRGTANRAHRNMLVFLAADENRLAELDTAVRDYLGWTHVLDNEADLDLSTNQRNQATNRKASANQTVEARLAQTFGWVLVPVQPDPAQPHAVKEVKVEGSAGASLAERVAKKLGSDGDLALQQSATNVRMALSLIPAVWQDGHVSLGQLWGLYTQYPYLPRLRDRAVLTDGITQMPLLWQTDGFALASAFDTERARYVGLWTSEEGTPPPAVSDSVLLVRPDVAVRQRTAERAAALDGTAIDPTGGNDPVRPSPGGNGAVDLVWPPDPAVIEVNTRFFGVKTLNPDRFASDFKTIADEVIAHLRHSGTDLRVRIEIEADRPSGFTDAETRTVSENSQTLKFEQFGFEKS